MLYSYVRIPGTVWRFKDGKPYLDVKASLDSVDGFWYNFHYPDLDPIQAKEYVTGILKKIGEDPDEIAQRMQDARGLEKRMNYEVQKRDPKERQKALRIAKVIRSRPEQSPFSILANRKKKAEPIRAYQGEDDVELVEYELPGNDNLIPLEKAVLLK